MPSNSPSIGAQSFMEDGEGDEANCNGGVFIDSGGISINGGFGGGGSGNSCHIKHVLNYTKALVTLPVAEEATLVVEVVPTKVTRVAVAPCSDTG